MNKLQAVNIPFQSVAVKVEKYWRNKCFLLFFWLKPNILAQILPKSKPKTK
jgi:hypothetical protein